MKATWRLCTSAGQRICDVTPNDTKLNVNRCTVLTSSPKRSKPDSNTCSNLDGLGPL